MVSKYHERGRSKKPRNSKLGYSSTMDSSDSFVQDLSPGGILDSLLVCAGIDTTTMDIYDFMDETEEEIKRSFRKAANGSTFDSEDYTLDSSRDDSRRHRRKSKSRSKKKKDKKKSRSKSRKKKDSRDSTSSSSSNDTRLAKGKRDPPPRMPINPLLHPSMRNLNPVVNPVGMQQSPLLMRPLSNPLNMNSATPPGVPPGLSPIAPPVGVPVLPRHSSTMGLGQIPPQATTYAQTLANISPTRSVRSIDPLASANLPGIHPRGISPSRSVRNFIDPSLEIGYIGVRPGERSLSPLARAMNRHHIPEMGIAPMGLPPRAMGLRNERPPQRMMRPEGLRQRRTSTSSGTISATSEDTMTVPSRQRERSSSRKREKSSSHRRERSSSRHRERSSSRRPDSRSSNMSSNVDERHRGHDRASSQSRVQNEPTVPVGGGVGSHAGIQSNIVEENNTQTMKSKNQVLTQEEITEMIRKERIQQYRSATDLNNSNPTLRNPKIMDRKLTNNTDLFETVIPPGELGMTIVKNSEGLTVVKLTDNSVVKDINIGDVIVALDGVDVSDAKLFSLFHVHNAI